MEREEAHAGTAVELIRRDDGALILRMRLAQQAWATRRLVPEEASQLRAALDAAGVSR
jgi:hypothetical protein